MKQTTRSLVSLLALVLVAGGVAGIAYWANRDEQKKTEAKEQSEKLFAAARDEVRGVRLEKAGKLVAALRRDSATAPWKIVEPLQADTDETAVSGFVDAALGLKQKREIGDEGDAKAYGLDAPQLRLSLQLATGKDAGVEIGADNAFDQTVFVRRTGEKTVRAMDGWTKSGIDKSLFDLRDKRIARLDPGAEVVRLEVSGVKQPWALAKDGKGWKLAAPTAEPADAATADRLVSALTGLRATAIAAESAPLLAAYGLSPAKVTVKLQVGKEAAPRTLEFGQVIAGTGSVTAKTYAKRGDAPIVYELDGQILKDLDKTVAELEDKQLVHAAREELRRLELAPEGGAKFAIASRRDAARDGGVAEEKFEFVPPQAGRQVKVWKASSALYALAQLRAAAIDGPAPTGARELSARGLDRPNVAVLYGEGDKLLARVRFGGLTKDGTRRYALVDGVAKLFEVEKSSADELPWKLDDVAEPANPPDAGAPHASK